MLPGFSKASLTKQRCYHARADADTAEWKERTMNVVKLAGMAVLAGLLTACSSPQDRAAEAQQGAYEAQEKVAKERLELVSKYQACVKEAGGNHQKVEACDSYLRAAEALK